MPPPPLLEPATAAEHSDEEDGLAPVTAAEHSDEEEGLEPWEVGLGHCGGYETAEGPYVLQEIITDEPPPPPLLEPATAAEHSDEEDGLAPATAAEHSDEEEGLEPWEVGLGHCGGYETAEGPYVLEEMITDKPPPPPPPLEPADEDLEPWEIELEQETGALRYPEEMVSG